MGWRFRRSARIFPGVRVNVTKNGLGLSFSPFRGLNYSVHSSGRRTASVGLPGTGLYWTESWYGDGKRRSSPREPARSMQDAAEGIDSAETREQVTTFADRLEAGEATADDISRLRAALDDPGWAATSESSILLQPLPWIELQVPSSAAALRLLAACHLLATGAAAEGERLAATVPSSDERQLVVMCARLLGHDPAGVLAVGPAEVDSTAAWVAMLLRADALVDCYRGAEALVLLDELDAAVAFAPDSTEARDIADCARARALLQLDRPAEACRVLGAALARDPFDTDAVDLLVAAQGRLVPSEGTELSLRDPDRDVDALRRALMSLERELLAARGDLADLVDELGKVAAEQDRRLGNRLLRRATLKAALARLVARLSADPADEAAADQLEGDLREQERDQREREQEHARQDQVEREADAQQAAVDPDEAAELKRLFKRCARRWHPDLATDENDRAMRNEMMQRVNAYYAARDLEGLRRLWESGVLDDTGVATGVDALRARIVEMASEIELTRAQLADLLASPLEQLRRDIEQAQAEGRDLLEEMAQLLDTEIADLLAGLEELRSTPSE